MIFSTPGTGFQVSATAASGTPVRFANINPSYSTTFVTFSPERLFTAVSSNVTDVSFFVPGTALPATVSSFGAIFSDVDNANTTTLEFFDPSNTSLGIFSAPVQGGDVSFVGVVWNAGEKISRVRITSGNTALGPNDAPPAADVVAMDDFLYSEPQLLSATPLPIPTLQQAAIVLLSLLLGFVAIAFGRGRAIRR